MVTPVAWWVHTSLLDTDAFIGVVEPVFENEDVAASPGDGADAEEAVAVRSS
jgi:hypothetical protein